MEVEYIVKNGSLYCKRGEQEVEVRCTVEEFLNHLEKEGR